MTSRIDGALYAVVRVHAVEDVHPALLRHGPMKLDGEDPARGWIANVRFADDGSVG